MIVVPNPPLQSINTSSNGLALKQLHTDYNACQLIHLHSIIISEMSCIKNGNQLKYLVKIIAACSFACYCVL